MYVSPIQPRYLDDLGSGFWTLHCLLYLPVLPTIISPPSFYLASFTRVFFPFSPFPPSLGEDNAGMV